MQNIYCIYKATCISTNKSYIGFTSDFLQRKRSHKNNAFKQSNRVSIFYNAIRKYGWENFTWEILYKSNDKDFCLSIMETYLINKYNTLSPNGYNLKLGGDGGELTEDSRKKISDRMKGKKLSEDHIENLRLSHLGKKLSEETKRKIGIALKRQKGIKRKPLTEECKLNLSKALKGKKHPYKAKLRCCCIICHQEISNNHVGLHYKHKHK